jgi:multiple sugar transport system permease protein
VFFSIILLQTIPALTPMTLFHFFFTWSDFFQPLVYLADNPDKFPISIGLTAFKQLYSQQTNLIQASSLIAALLMLLVFFLAQRVFMQGMIVSGVEK